MSEKTTQGNLRAVEEFFIREIPLTRAMGLRLVPAEGGDFAVEAPVALNSNHLQTAFGGSINAVATLAAYGFLWQEVRGEGAHMVISESTIRFLRPIRETIRARCVRPDTRLLGEFMSTLRSKGKSRIALRVEVTEDDALAAEFGGVFVARLRVGL